MVIEMKHDNNFDKIIKWGHRKILYVIWAVVSLYGILFLILYFIDKNKIIENIL